MVPLSMPTTAEPSTEHWHGTYNGYANRECRGPKCRAANAAFRLEAKKKRFKQTLDPTHPLHGTANFYGNYGCRCQRCKAGWSATIGRPGKERKTLIEDLRALSPHTESEALASAAIEARRLALEEAMKTGALQRVSGGARYAPRLFVIPPEHFGKQEAVQWFVFADGPAQNHLRAIQMQHHLSYRVGQLLAGQKSHMGILAAQVNKRHDAIIKSLRGHRILREKDARLLYEALGKDYQEFLADFSAHYPE